MTSVLLKYLFDCLFQQDNSRPHSTRFNTQRIEPTNPNFSIFKTGNTTFTEHIACVFKLLLFPRWQLFHLIIQEIRGQCVHTNRNQSKNSTLLLDFKGQTTNFCCELFSTFVHNDVTLFCTLLYFGEITQLGDHLERLYCRFCRRRLCGRILIVSFLCSYSCAILPGAGQEVLIL